MYNLQCRGAALKKQLYYLKFKRNIFQSFSKSRLIAGDQVPLITADTLWRHWMFYGVTVNRYLVSRQPTWSSSWMFQMSNGPRQANLVLIAYASSEGSGESAHSSARSYKQWVKRNLQTESQIPGPSEWLDMRS